VVFIAVYVSSTLTAWLQCRNDNLKKPKILFVSIKTVKNQKFGFQCDHIRDFVMITFAVYHQFEIIIIIIINVTQPVRAVVSFQHYDLDELHVSTPRRGTIGVLAE